MDRDELKRPRRMSGPERRQQLLDTAIHLFALNGFKGTTTKEIAEAAGISQAVIFQHFTTKDELYSAILNHKMLKGEAEFFESLEKTARRKHDRALFKKMASHIVHYFLHDPAYMRLLLYSGLEGHELSRLFIQQDSEPLHEFTCRYIDQRIKDGAFRPVNPPIASRAFFGMVYNQALVMVLFDDPILQAPIKKVLDEFVDVFLQGITRK